MGVIEGSTRAESKTPPSGRGKNQTSRIPESLVDRWPAPSGMPVAVGWRAGLSAGQRGSTMPMCEFCPKKQASYGLKNSGKKHGGRRGASSASSQKPHPKYAQELAFSDCYMVLSPVILAKYNSELAFLDVPGYS